MSLDETFSTALTGQLPILMKDAPIDDLSEVHVYLAICRDARPSG